MHCLWAVYNNRTDKYTFTLIGYALLYYIGEILRRGMHNLSYIYGNACINIAYPYTKVFSHTIKGRFCVPPRKTSPILYRKDFAYPRAEHLPYYIGRILRTPRKTSPILYRKDFVYPTQNISYNI